MRITVDYQFSDRNYSRFVAFGGVAYDSEKLKIGVSIYNENDAKNQPLQQNLSSEQVQILADAGDDISQMVAPSAVPEAFNENRILYRKEIIGGIEAFVFSNDPEDDLFSVKFSLVGANQGNYIVNNTNAVANIYEFVAPQNGIPQGNYAPIVQLIAPTKLQMAIINGSYMPSEKTVVDFELAGSKNDLNLFSDLDDANNDGFAGKLKFTQHIIKSDSLWNIKAFADADYIDENFKTIERLYNAEFTRDWNLDSALGNQKLLVAGLHVMHPSKGIANYQFENLNYSENFNGNRHIFLTNLRLNKFQIFSQSSYLNAASNSNKSTFLRSYNRLVYNYSKKGWIGTKVALEENKQRTIATNELTPLSQRFTSYEAFTGVGDSTGVFVEVGYKYRVNDSLRNSQLKRVNRSNTYYLKSKLVQKHNYQSGTVR